MTFITDTSHKFYLSSIADFPLIIQCEYIEFVKNIATECTTKEVKREPHYQWQGAQGYEWWELPAAKDKFLDSEKQLTISINEKFIITAFTTKRWYEYFWYNIYINNIYYKTACEHVDEDLFWLIDNLENLVFLQDIKKQKIKIINKSKFNKKRTEILSKPNLKAFNYQCKMDVIVE